MFVKYWESSDLSFYILSASYVAVLQILLFI